MNDVTDTPTPVLTPEEWARVVENPAEDGPVGIALINHALPDGHPLKLMGEDIQLLGAAAFAFRELSAYAETDHSRGVRLEYEQHVLALSRKLAALLQP